MTAPLEIWTVLPGCRLVFEVGAIEAERPSWPGDDAILTALSERVLAAQNVWREEAGVHASHHLHCGRVRVRAGSSRARWSRGPGDLGNSLSALADGDARATELALLLVFHQAQGLLVPPVEWEGQTTRLFAAGSVSWGPDGPEVAATDDAERTVRCALEAWLTLDQQARNQGMPRPDRHILVLPDETLSDTGAAHLIRRAREHGLPLVVLPASDLATMWDGLEALGLSVEGSNPSLLDRVAAAMPSAPRGRWLAVAALSVLLAGGALGAKFLGGPGGATPDELPSPAALPAEDTPLDPEDERDQIAEIEEIELNEALPGDVGEEPGSGSRAGARLLANSQGGAPESTAQEDGADTPPTSEQAAREPAPTATRRSTPPRRSNGSVRAQALPDVVARTPEATAPDAPTSAPPTFHFNPNQTIRDGQVVEGPSSGPRIQEETLDDSPAAPPPGGDPVVADADESEENSFSYGVFGALGDDPAPDGGVQRAAADSPGSSITIRRREETPLSWSEDVARALDGAQPLAERSEQPR